MIREITKDQFKSKIEQKDGDFSDCIFNFPLTMSEFLGEDMEITFEVDFNSCVFKDKVSFSKVSFKKHFNFSNCIVEYFIDFYNTRFHEGFLCRKTDFLSKVSFDLSRFYSDADFSRSTFSLAVHFKKVRFQKNLFMGNVIFCSKIDFSYAHFSNNYYTNFTSINKNKTHDGKNPGAPFFIFRNIFFPKKTVFSEVNLSRVIFQNSIIDKINFKDCVFSKKNGRNVFYSEILKNENIEIKENLNLLENEKINTIILPKTERLEILNIGDTLEVYSVSENRSKRFFIVTKFDAKNAQELKDFLEDINYKKMYSDFSKIVCHDCSNSEDETNGVFGFRLKEFNEHKYWNVLEDNNRQMKKSLEESKDWHGSGDFYIGEMHAKIHLLKKENRNFTYRITLIIYRFISTFGESIKRIFIMMICMFIFGMFFLKYAKPEMDIFEITGANIKFFFPIFGSNSDIINSLKLEPWEEVVIQIEIIWFYFLWVIMAVSGRRRFRR